MRAPVWIRVLQFLSIFFMWAFALAVLVFVPWLVFVAARWHDALNWSLAISVVMTPVDLTVAGTLTYVFIGLQRGARRDQE
jgi:cation transport ATPase